MCPACISTATIVVGGAFSSSSLAALAIAVRRKLSDKKETPNTNRKDILDKES